MNANIKRKYLQAFAAHAKTIQLLENLHAQKLWNELSNQILKLLFAPDVKGRVNPDFYREFVKTFETSIDPIKLIKIIRQSITTLSSKDKLEFLQEFQKSAPLSDQSKLVVRALEGLCYVDIDNTKCLPILESIRKQIDSQKDIEKFVYSTFYEFSFKYYRSKSKFKLFYTNALQYLAYTPNYEISEGDKINLSFEMGKSVLLSQEIYNFSQLLDQRLLRSLLDKESTRWCYQLLQIFNKGDVKAFQNFIRSPSKDAQEFLSTNRLVLQQKIRIMAFLEQLFNLPKNDRVLSFDKIAAHAAITQDDVELIVMRTIALGLAKGGIDQIKKTVTITWVAPKVLQFDRVKVMEEKFGQWSSGLDRLIKLIENPLEQEIQE